MDVICSAPFFGALLMRLPMIPDESVPTMRTDGRCIRYSARYVTELNDSDLRGVLAHEVAHCAQGHLWRMGSRNLKKWNQATDYQINEMLESYEREERAAFEAKHGEGRYLAPWTIPGDLLRAPQFANLASEEIYARLPDEDDDSKSGASSSGSPSPGHAKPGTSQPQPAHGKCASSNDPSNASSPGEFEAAAPGDEGNSTEQDWTIAVTQAATAAKMRGQLPASLRRFVDELVKPKVPWREVLREFIRTLARDDYSWRQPNRRYLHAGFVLPSLRSERMGRLAIAIDNSGSIDAQILATFQAETQAALDECSPEAIEVIYCDAAVQKIEEFVPGDTVRLDSGGGGGTDFRPVFRHLDQSDEPPVALIYLTDGYGRFPDSEPEYPVLWASTARDDFPFGPVVTIK